MALELGQVEVRAAAARDQLPGVMEEVQGEIEDPAGHRLAIDGDVLLGQVPAARPDEQHRGLLAKGVALAFGRGEVDPAADGVAQVDVALDVVVPPRCVGVLEVRHEDLRAGVERVHDHLAIDRPGDLDPPVLDVGRGRRAGPVALADGAGVRQEVGQAAGIELRLSCRPPCQQRVAPRAEGTLQLHGEGDRLGCQDFRELGRDPAVDVDTGTVRGLGHGVDSGLDVEKTGSAPGTE